MALGTTILGASTLGAGLLIGGVIFSISGSAVSNKAETAYDQMKEAEKVIKDLKDLRATSQNYYEMLLKVSKKYDEWFKSLKETVNCKTDWQTFSEQEKIDAENTVLAVGLLYEMCKIKLVLASKNNKEKNVINYKDIEKATNKAVEFLEQTSSTIGWKDYGDMPNRTE